MNASRRPSRRRCGSTHAALRTGRDRERQTARLRVGDPFDDTRSHDLEREQFVAVRTSAVLHHLDVDRLAGVESRAEQLDEIDPTDRTDLGGPLLHRQWIAAMVGEHLGPGREDRRLRIEDQPVEVEHDRADHSKLSAGSIGLASETPPSAATIWPVTQSSRHSPTMASATSAALPKRPRADAARDPLLVARQPLRGREHRRVGGAGCDGVHADAERTELTRAATFTSAASPAFDTE